MLSGGTQCRAFASTPERNNENVNLINYRIEIESTTGRVYNRILRPCAATMRHTQIKKYF